TITLPVTEEQAKELNIGDKVKLVQNGVTYGVLEVSEVYTPNKEKEAENVYRTAELAHPGVKKMMERPNVYVAGPIVLVERTPKTRFEKYYLDPT
ncbi:hypothetical protein LV454_28495, partial [Escherichia coli]|nr:hypothetical protein [Escherichia coli]